MEVPDKLLEMAVKAYGESVRQTWKMGGRRPKLYRKTQEQKIVDKAVLITYLDILSRVFDVTGGLFTLMEMAEASNIINEAGMCRDDPSLTEMEKLIVKGKG